MKKIVSFFLAFTLLIPSLAFTSCKKEEKVTKKEEVKQDVEAMEGDIFSERAAIDDELLEYDFEGREFRVVSHSPEEYFVEEENKNQGNLISDSLFERNLAAESRFNFKVTTAFSGTYTEVNDWVSKSVLSGVDEFDLYLSHAADAGKVVLKNLFINWYDVPNVDFNKPWWSTSSSNELTYDGKCILAISDLCLSSITGTYCMYFNKNLVNSYDMGNLYDVALNGDWTYEYFYNLIKDVYRDDDGDGLKSIGDFYGFEQKHWYATAPNAWLYAFNNPTIKKDEDGVPQIAIKTDKINSIVDSIYDLCYNTNGAWYINTNDSNNDLFLAKKAIFCIDMIGRAAKTDFRNFDDEYGILPMPKWNESQVNYTTTALGSHTVIAVPKTATNLEFIGTCVEALSAESYKKVIPTYYEIALKTRYLRDNESKEVLDLILGSRIYDFGILYGNWKGFEFCLSSLMMDGNNNFESYYQKNYNTAKLHYRAITKVFDRLK